MAVDSTSRRRAVSWTLDGALVGGVAVGGVLALGADAEWLLSAPGVGFVLVLGFVYLGWLTSPSGQSPGKRITGLRVTRSSGKPPGRGRLLGRAAFDMVTLGLFILVCDVFDLQHRTGETLLAAVAGALILPGFLIAWWLRDQLLDIELVRA
jgi:uncharacterized RDD family membrane protein YckC